MAEYHLHAQIIKRSEGRSAVACAAYRAGVKLHDERLMLTWNFSKKPGVEHSEILAPAGAPDWVFDRQQLWNAVEWSERYKNAQLARELDVSLPVELSPNEQLALARAFVQEQLVSRGMVCDFSIHREDPGNPHFHVMATMRELDSAHFARTKQRAWNSHSLVPELRVAWEHTANLALAYAGHAARIDHRSFHARGIELAARPKRFRKTTEAARDGREHVAERTQEAHRTAQRNGDLIIERPENVLLLLSSKSATFSERDLLKVVHRHTASPAQFERALARVRSCPQLVTLRCEPNQEQRYTTRATVDAERAILTDAHLLAQRSAHRVDDALVAQALQLSDRTLNAGQENALRHVTRGGDFAIVEGYAGTGKSTMLQVARLAWEAQGSIVVGAALAGKAAGDLQHDAGIPSRTLHAWLWRWQVRGERLSSRHVFVIDEAAMVGTAQMQAVIEEVRRAGAKLILVGDDKQLASIDPGAPMRMLKSHYQPAVLATILRQRDHEWQRDATLAFATERDGDALQAYRQNDRIVACANETDAKRKLVEAWANDRLAYPSESSLMLAFRRRDVHAINQLAREVRKKRMELGSDQPVLTERGPRKFAAGDRIFFLKNNSELQVKNGTLGTVERMEGTEMLVRLDQGGHVAFDTRRYRDFDHGYAGTIHKSQGATVKRTYVLASRYMDGPATYVALSRHERDAHMFYSRNEFRNVEALVARLSRRKAVSMAHDLLGEQPSPRKLERQLAREIQALSVRPADRLAELEALRLASMRRRMTVEEALANLPELKRAEAAARERLREVDRATQSRERFSALHPHRTRLGLGGYTDHVTRLEQARKNLQLSEARLGQLRADPALRDCAARISKRHNASVHTALSQWRQCVADQQELSLRADVSLRALSANRRARGLVARLATALDRGRTLKFVTHDDGTVVLRDHAGGPAVFATPRQCDEHGWPKTNAQAFERTHEFARQKNTREPG